jgi:hypothetical protein
LWQQHKIYRSLLSVSTVVVRVVAAVAVVANYLSLIISGSAASGIWYPETIIFPPFKQIKLPSIK